MQKVLCLLTIPSKADGTEVQLDPSLFIQHPQCADINGNMLPIVRVDAVVILPEGALTVHSAVVIDDFAPQTVLAFYPESARIAGVLDK
jgi:hypothetical protein